MDSWVSKKVDQLFPYYISKQPLFTYELNSFLYLNNCNIDSACRHFIHILNGLEVL